MPEQQNQFQKRQIAYKIRISDILSGNFVKEDTSAGYIKTGNAGISRVNIIATAVYKSEQPNYSSLIVDDGTGKILLRSFENSDSLLKIDVGDFVQVIGKLREFNDERYIIPEILKKIVNAQWLNLRKQELENQKYYAETPVSIGLVIPEYTPSNFNDDIYSMIKNLDNGDGVFVDEIIKKSGHDNTENIIKTLLENGDIFEMSPGKLKVLE